MIVLKSQIDFSFKKFYENNNQNPVERYLNDLYKKQFMINDDFIRNYVIIYEANHDLTPFDYIQERIPDGIRIRFRPKKRMVVTSVYRGEEEIDPSEIFVGYFNNSLFKFAKIEDEMAPNPSEYLDFSRTAMNDEDIERLVREFDIVDKLFVASRGTFSQFMKSYANSETRTIIKNNIERHEPDIYSGGYKEHLLMMPIDTLFHKHIEKIVESTEYQSMIGRTTRRYQLLGLRDFLKNILEEFEMADNL